KIGREGLKRRLANIEGVYAPELYRIEYFPQGEISLFAPVDKGVPARVRRRVAPDLDRAFFPEQWLVPYIRLVHDRLILEIMRGCPHSCRFCQARVVYRPWRRRSAERIIGLAKDLLPASGYGEISLLGLSCGDHPQLSQIISRIITLYRDKGINLSLPSLRIRDYLGDIPSLLGQMKKTGLTFAPEAASGRLRKIINKEMDTQQLFDVVAKAYRVGYRHIKLYFMIGLPGEIAQDLREIADMAVSLAEMRRRIDGRPGRVTLSISAFSPKPHTEFERLAMDDIETLARKQKYIRSCFRGRRRGIKIDFSDAHTAFLETVLSRADRRVCGVIEEAFRLRAGRNFGLWLRAFEARGVNPYFYVNREFSRGEILPWGHIDVGKKNIA
ncbi:MAG: radical SAM protein, partial [Candidatus Omnitrophota bacterium]